jgi:hypothetical protein
MQIKSAKDLLVYQKAYQHAMEAFVLSKNFPHCGCLTSKEHDWLVGMSLEVGKMLGAMIQRPGAFLLTSDL